MARATTGSRTRGHRCLQSDGALVDVEHNLRFVTHGSMSLASLDGVDRLRLHDGGGNNHASLLLFDVMALGDHNSLRIDSATW